MASAPAIRSRGTPGADMSNSLQIRSAILAFAAALTLAAGNSRATIITDPNPAPPPNPLDGGAGAAGIGGVGGNGSAASADAGYSVPNSDFTNNAFAYGGSGGAG